MVPMSDVLTFAHGNDGERASDPTPVLPCDDATVRENLERVLGEARGEYPRAFFDNVRARFVWFDATGNDIFRPVLNIHVRRNAFVLNRPAIVAREEPSAWGDG